MSKDRRTTRTGKKPGQNQDSPKKRTAKDFLKAHPYKNSAIKITSKRNGTALVEVPMKKPKYLVPPFSWIIPFSSYRRVELDPVGARVLNLCDGERSVEQIIENFAQINKLSFREAQLSVTQFLRMLMERGIVALVGVPQRNGTQRA
jgi:hypothetical protein